MKRIIAILLCTACLLGALAACRTQANTLPQTKTDETPATSTYDDRYQFLPTATTAPPKPTEPPTAEELAEKLLKDYKGIEITEEHVEAMGLFINYSEGHYNFGEEVVNYFNNIQNQIKEKIKDDPDYRYKIESEKVAKTVTYDYGAFYWENTLISFNDYGVIKLYSVVSGTKQILSFADNEVLEKIVIPDTVTKIRSGALKNCPSLVTVDFDNSVGKMTDPYYASGLRSYYKIEEPVSYNNLFVKDGDELSKSYIEGWYGSASSEDYYEVNYQEMEEQYNKYFSNVKVVDDDPDNYVILNGVLMAYTGIGGHIVIPEGVTEICGNVFTNCSENILSIKFPSTLKVLKSWNIVGLVHLLDLTMPDGLEKIESQAVIHGQYDRKNNAPGSDFERKFIKINNIPEDCEVAEDAFSSGTMWAYKYFYNK